MNNTNILFEHERSKYIAAHNIVLDCFSKVDGIVKFQTASNETLSIENLAETVVSEEKSTAIHYNYIDRLAIAFRILIEIKKIRQRGVKKEFLQRLVEIEKSLMSIKDNAPAIYDDVVFLVSIVCFQGAMLDMCEPENWPDETINKYADESVFESIRTYSIADGEKFKLSNSVCFKKYILKWFYGWKWFIPRNEILTRNDGGIWLEKAAKKGNKKAIKLLARHYGRKWLPDENHQKEAFYYMQAAIKGDREAQRTFACYCYQGYGVQASVEEAVKWWRKAVSQGDIRSARMLGQTLLFQKDSDNNKEAYNMLKMASEKNDEEATRLLAYCYGNGIGVEENLQKAFELYRTASRGGDAIAMWNLSMALFDGEGVDKNLIEAYAWMLEAVKKGCNLTQAEELKIKKYRDELEMTLSEDEKIAAKNIIT